MARSDLLLAVDVGNTNVVVGVLRGRRVEAQWRLSSYVGRTSDEISLLLRELCRDHEAELSRSRRVALASVVPSLTSAFVGAARTHYGADPLVVSADLDLGIEIAYHDPSSVGADRIANAVAARVLHGDPAIVVDLGTATTLDVISKGRYEGGVIAPGVLTSADALMKRAARLARVEIRRPSRAVGRTTEESMQAGIYFGAVGQIDALVRRIRKEMRFRPRVIGTGGLASLIAGDSETIDVVDDALTLQGLRLIYERNRDRRRPGRTAT
jgi:type III pantothenate kinase